MMAGIVDVMRDAVGALDYAADALEAPAGSHMRQVCREMKAARVSASEMVVSLEWALGFIGAYGDEQAVQAESEMLAVVLAVLDRARGEA